MHDAGLQDQNLSAEPSTPTGYLDGVDSEYLYGWFIHPIDKHPALSLVVDGQILNGGRDIFCELSRPDLPDSSGDPARCGFGVELHGLDSKRVHRISVLHEDTGFDFHGECLCYCPEVSKRATELRAIFLPEYYRCQYRHETMSNEQAFRHYLQFGVYADLNPNPWFDTQYLREHYADALAEWDLPVLGYLAQEKKLLLSPSEKFDTRWYRKEHQDIRKEPCLLAHFVSHGNLEGRQAKQLVLNPNVQDELERLSEFEPDLKHVGKKIYNIIRYPRIRVETYVPRLIKRRFAERPAAVVCVPFLSHGGADLISTFVLKSLERRFGEGRVLMLVTDRHEHSVSGWTDPTSNIVFLDESDGVSNLSDRIDLLHTVIACLSPGLVVNVNSHAAWAMYVHYGKQLSRSMNLHANLFCFDYGESGLLGGYIRDYLPRALPYLSSLCCDNATIITDIRKLFGFAEEQMQKFHTVYVPLPETCDALPTEQFARADGTILWIGRLARQKRPELLVQLAERMPTQRFDVYGPAGDSPLSSDIRDNRFPNIRYCGVYDSLSSVRLSDYSMLVNTSAWEGLPTLLIQIMATGLPIVTSRAGGITELVDEKTGWLVPDDHDVESYRTQIRQMLLHREEALARSARGRERVNKRHTWDAYMDRLDKAGCFRVTVSGSRPRLLEVPYLNAG